MPLVRRPNAGNKSQATSSASEQPIAQPYDNPLTTVQTCNSPRSQAPNPYEPQQYLIYLKFLLPLLIVFILPFSFAIRVHSKGRLPTPQWLEDFTLANPRVTPQIVTVIASAFTAATRWALGGAAALLARKRLLKPRPILEIDLFTSLKYISVAGDWKRRKGMMFATFLVVVLGGLLTSGFVTLFNPLPMQTTTRLSPSKELDVFTDQTNCVNLYTQVYQSFITRGVDDSISLSTDPEARNALDLTANRLMALNNTAAGLPAVSSVATFKPLNFTRISGTTGGTLITGPAGFNSRTSQGSPVYPFPDVPTRKQRPLSYSLNLQALWADTSCYYDHNSPFTIIWPPNRSTFERYQMACPGSTQLVNGTTCTGCALVFECPLDNDVRGLYFRDSRPKPHRMTNLTCTFTPRAGEAEAVLDPDIQAFKVSKNESSTKALRSSVAKDLFGMTVRRVKSHVDDAAVINALLEPIVFRVGDKGADSVWLDAMELGLQAVFELEATYWRKELVERIRTLNGQENAIPTECLRDVHVQANERMIGWELKSTTVLGLVPLMIVCIASFAMIGSAMIAAGKLTVFDPMNPVSLIGATSIGGVRFPKEVSEGAGGDPLDKTVLVTKVSYEQGDQNWGLRSSER